MLLFPTSRTLKPWTPSSSHYGSVIKEPSQVTQWIASVATSLPPQHSPLQQLQRYSSSKSGQHNLSNIILFYYLSTLYLINGFCFRFWIPENKASTENNKIASAEAELRCPWCIIAWKILNLEAPSRQATYFLWQAPSLLCSPNFCSPAPFSTPILKQPHLHGSGHHILGGFGVHNLIAGWFLKSNTVNRTENPWTSRRNPESQVLYTVIQPTHMTEWLNTFVHILTGLSNDQQESWSVIVDIATSYEGKQDGVMNYGSQAGAAAAAVPWCFLGIEIIEDVS